MRLTSHGTANTPASSRWVPVFSYLSPPFSPGASTLDTATIERRLTFLREAERLKTVLRSGYTTAGEPESTAEHTWRLCLMAIVFEDALGDVDMLQVLKLCVVHDLGEAINGDIPAIHQDAYPDRHERERNDVQTLTAPLDPETRGTILALWDEYDRAETPEAKAVKALDKLETILQHNQGQNPPDFDYGFNLGYARQHTEATPFFRAVREILDGGTRARLDGTATPRRPAGNRS